MLNAELFSYSVVQLTLRVIDYVECKTFARNEAIRLSLCVID